jgi:hypothetical protein
MVDTILAIWVMATANKAYDEITAPPPVIKVEKVIVPAELYYPNLTDDMWDPNWINKKS